MKSLKPEIQKSASLITQKTADELRSEIAQLQASLISLQDELSDIEDELNVPNVGRGSPTFDSVTTTNLTSTNSSLGTVTFDNATGNQIVVSDVESVNVTATGVVDAPHVNTDDLDATDLEADNVKVNVKIDTPVVDTDTITATDATIENATIANLNATNASIATYQVNKVDANEVETPLVTATEAVLNAAAIDDAEIQNEVVMEGEIVNLKNRNRYFKDETQTISVEATALRPAYIAIPTKGVQIARIVATDDLGEQFSVIYNNARHTPLIQWSKRSDDALNKMFYSENTNTLYLQTYMSANIQWSIDGYEDLPHAPLTYSETFPEPISDCFRYNSARKQGIVLMGDGEDGVVLSVQGTIEGDFLVDSGEFVSVNYYGNSAWKLLKIAQAFFRNGSDEEGWKYQKAEVYGYIRHDDVVTPAHWEYSAATVESTDFTFDGVNTYTPNDSLFLEDASDYTEVAKVEFDGVELYTAYDSSDNVLATNASLTGFDYYTREWVTPSHSPYRDEDNTEVEALEKIEMIDNYTVKLTVDSDYGQDEITIDCTDIAEDETLPFTLGFTVRTPKIDATFNEDSPVIPGGRATADFNGQF